MLKDTFCSSPWFHLRIDPAGNYLPCRWADALTPSKYNIRDVSMSEYLNSPDMQSLRMQLLNGQSPDLCGICKSEDSQNKVSGRQRQLLKSAITLGNFEKSLCASPHFDIFDYSHQNQGKTNYVPVDLQIDLGNTCNSACVMCAPQWSSKLAKDYEKLNSLQPTIFANHIQIPNWTDDQQLVDKFVDDIEKYPEIQYIHFLGGETLYIKSLYNICNRLIESGFSHNVSIGTTTNCTVYSAELERIIREFKHVHLGLSIESFHKINDYVRWPGDIRIIEGNIRKFLDLRSQTGMHLALRITPSLLTILHLDTVFRFMLENNIVAESCNILYKPTWLRLELLPKYLIDIIRDKIDQVIVDYKLVQSQQTIVNRRRDDLTKQVISEVIFEYKHLLGNLSEPANVEEERHKLVIALKSFESLRSNKILDYLPEYEEFLRSYGY